MEGGVFSIIEDGDIITIDIKNRSINLEVKDDIIKERIKNWKKPVLKVKKGYLVRYSRMVSSAENLKLHKNYILKILLPINLA